FDISEGQDIENAIQNIRGTSVTNLKPNRDRNLNPTCLNKRNLIKELSLRGIEVNEKENRSILVLNLKIQLENDIKNAKL
ncbi:2517_t:CDS:2, partial [Racocetra persica]